MGGGEPGGDGVRGGRRGLRDALRRQDGGGVGAAPPRRKGAQGRQEGQGRARAQDPREAIQLEKIKFGLKSHFKTNLQSFNIARRASKLNGILKPI